MPTTSSPARTTLPFGAELIDPAQGNAQFRVWAPERKRVEVVFKDGRAPVALTRGQDGYFSGAATNLSAGTAYKYRMDGDGEFPDPASRFQPQGPHGWSALVDPKAFSWTDASHKGIQLEGQVVYEMHLGTFTPEGTWNSAAEKLAYLKETGITVLEIMPVADFPGRFGWGYDGVQLYAPASIYGTPDEMRRFVDRAHSLGLAVILDVVYNHIGPDGNYLAEFSPHYFSNKHMTDWGKGINYDGESCGPVREFFRENAAYWIREFHLDGLRLDATQDIHDDSEPHVLIEIGESARAAAGHRGVILIAENEPQETKLVRALDKGGYGLNALWNDDLHHTATVAMTGKSDAYYTDYRGTAAEFVAGLKYGYLYQGQWYKWQKKRRGHSTFGIPRSAMVTFSQNHDQIANSAHGLRAHELTSSGRYKAVTAALILGPGTPMLFQGQEFASSSKFLFFADHNKELAGLVEKGRVEFLEQWRSHRKEEMKACFANPSRESTFNECKLDFSEVEKHASMYRLHCDLLKLRREDPVISKQGADGLDGAVLSPQAFVIRFFSPEYREDRLLVVNLGGDLDLNPAPEPLLGPPEGRQWEILWSTDDPQYGGCGTAPVDSDENWRIPGEAAVVLYPIDQQVDQKFQQTTAHPIK